MAAAEGHSGAPQSPCHIKDEGQGVPPGGAFSPRHLETEALRPRSPSNSTGDFAFGGGLKGNRLPHLVVSEVRKRPIGYVPLLTQGNTRVNLPIEAALVPEVRHVACICCYVNAPPAWLASWEGEGDL